MGQITLLKKIGLLCVKGKTVDCKRIGESYTAISSYYENYFLREMHTHNEAMLSQLAASKQEVNHVLDLACGTGFNSTYLKKHYHKAKFCLVDISEGMLNEAKKNGFNEKELIHQEMLSFLKAGEAKSFDVVVCSWAIKYQPPQKVIKEVYRLLKPGGLFGVIVNTKATLPEIRKIYPSLLVSYEKNIKEVMLELPNPKNKKVFDRWFLKEGFSLLTSKEGRQVFNFETEEDLAHWVTHTGALAGYDYMVDLKDAGIQKQICEQMKKKKLKQVTHTFVWGVFKK